VRVRVFPARKGSLIDGEGHGEGEGVGIPYAGRRSVGRSVLGFCSGQLRSGQVNSVQFSSGQVSSVQVSSVFRQRSGGLVSCILYPVSCILYPRIHSEEGGEELVYLAGRPMSRQQQQQQWSNGEMPRAGCVCRRGWDWTGLDGIEMGWGWVRGRERETWHVPFFPPSYGNGNWVQQSDIGAGLAGGRAAT
jgi:hypothetical protein